jgi:hypothetical protein
MSARKRKADKTDEITSSQTKLEDAYKKPRTRSTIKKEKEEVADSPKKEDIKKETCPEVIEVSSSTHELLRAIMADILLIKRDTIDTRAGLEKLLALAIQEQDGDSLEEM